MNILVYKLVLLYFIFYDLLDMFLSEENCKGRDVETKKYGDGDRQGEMQTLFSR